MSGRSDRPLPVRPPSAGRRRPRLVTKIRKIDPTIAVGLLCAGRSYALIEDVRAIGGVACLSKELDTADLVDAVASVFEGEVFSHPRSGMRTAPVGTSPQASCSPPAG